MNSQDTLELKHIWINQVCRSSKDQAIGLCVLFVCEHSPRRTSQGLVEPSCLFTVKQYVLCPCFNSRWLPINHEGRLSAATLGTRPNMRAHVVLLWQMGLIPLPLKQISPGKRRAGPITNIYLIWGKFNMMTVQRCTDEGDQVDVLLSWLFVWFQFFKVKRHIGLCLLITPLGNPKWH